MYNFMLKASIADVRTNTSSSNKIIPNCNLFPTKDLHGTVTNSLNNKKRTRKATLHHHRQDQDGKIQLPSALIENQVPPFIHRIRHPPRGAKKKWKIFFLSLA